MRWHNYYLIALVAYLTHTEQLRADTTKAMPCVTEICIGDNLDRLKTIDWDAVTNRPASPIKKQEYLPPIYNRYPDRISDYLYRGTFDRTIISHLQGMTSACKAHDLIGSYTSPSGHTTKVTIRLTPDVTGKQSWKVIIISRIIGGELNREELQQAFLLMDKKYSEFDYQHKPPKEWAGLYMRMFIGHPAFVLQLQLPTPDKLRKLYRMNPGCKAGNSFNIN